MRSFSSAAMFASRRSKLLVGEPADFPRLDEVLGPGCKVVLMAVLWSQNRLACSRAVGGDRGHGGCFSSRPSFAGTDAPATDTHRRNSEYRRAPFRVISRVSDCHKSGVGTAGRVLVPRSNPEHDVD